jgi:hypothetical protein
MANLKNITELPVAESADGLNLIVNDNGVAKQIAASEVGGSGGGAYVVDGATQYQVNPELHALLLNKWDNAPGDMPRVFVKDKAYGDNPCLSPVVCFFIRDYGSWRSAVLYWVRQTDTAGNITLCDTEEHARDAESKDMA